MLLPRCTDDAGPAAKACQLSPGCRRACSCDFVRAHVSPGPRRRCTLCGALFERQLLLGRSVFTQSCLASSN